MTTLTCCGDTEPSFYYVHTDTKDTEVYTICAVCRTDYIDLTDSELFDFFSSEGTKAFHTYEEAELYLIKERL